MANADLTPSFGLFGKSKKLVMDNFNTFGLLFLLPFLSGLFTSIRTRNMDGFERFSNTSQGFGGASTSLLGVGIGIGLLFGILSIIANLMIYALNLESAKGKKPGIGELWTVIKKYGFRLFFLTIVVGTVVILGFIALIVPGLIFLRRYFLAPYAMLDKDLSIGEAMKESARLSKPHSGSIWGLIGVSFVLSLPGVIPVFGWAVSFVLTSLYTVAPALRYLELKKLSA